MKSKKRVIGRVESIGFPEFGITEIDAKIDTGAYTSAIHCHEVKAFMKDDEEWVRFKLLDPHHPAFNHKEFTMPVFARKRIKNSFGQTQKRIIVQTKMLIFGKKYKIELSLADRSKLEFPVLLGRKAIRNRFVVDVSLKNVALSTNES
ncbi:MAG: RimK/LysX family protein [Balneolales bacterium]|nr:RimK/LysX family protein [Balneolales bacterium]